MIAPGSGDRLRGRSHLRLVAWLLLTLLFPAAADAGSDPDPLISLHDGFADEGTCASCHADQVAAFAQSHHAKAMAVANEMTVRADFNGTRFEHDGIVTTFSRRDGRFFVRTQGADGKDAEFEVKYTFAYEPLQQYLADIGGGRLQALDIAWDTAKGQWFWLGEGSPAKPGSTYHWAGPFYRWNRTCIDCHSTDPRTGFQPASGEYQSTYVATSIGCQSCHGAAAAHVKWAQAGASAAGETLQTDMPKVDATACFGCHSRRTKLLDGFGPGKPYLDHFTPALMRQDLYFPDGQILDEVFEYGSFQRSRMAKAGVVCLDCHKAHEGTLKAQGNALCAQCHAEAAPSRFAGYKPSGAFDTPAHTHHPVGSTGAQCVNCHMPERTYMKVDPRRDHSFVIPRPDLSEAYGVPNACTSCHAGQTNVWAAARMDEWYGATWRNRQTTAHAFAEATRGGQGAVEALRAFLADREQSAYVRASAISEMARIGGPAVATDIKAAAQDVDPLVRLGAAEAAANLPPELRQDAIGPLLADEARAVRVEAVAALAATPTSDLLGTARNSFDSAADDLAAYVRANDDAAEAQNRCGVFLSDQRRMDDAEKAFRQAIALDPSLSATWVNLAEMYRLAGDNAKSAETYGQAIAALPSEANLRYGHALALVRQKALPEAIRELEAAVNLEPRNTRYRTTLAIGLDSAGRTEEAFTVLDGAITTETRDPELLGTAIGYGLKLGRYSQTLKYAEQLAALQPENAQVAALVSQLRSIVASGGK